jgi:hypothetical protein
MTYERERPGETRGGGVRPLMEGAPAILEVGHAYNGRRDECSRCPLAAALRVSDP